MPIRFLFYNKKNIVFFTELWLVEKKSAKSTERMSFLLTLAFLNEQQFINRNLMYIL